MNTIIKIILAVFLIGSGGCWFAENTNTANMTNTVNTMNTMNTTNTANSTDTTNTANPATAPTTTNPPSENDVAVAGSPTQTLKDLYAASKTKNPAAIKKTLSKGSLALVEQSAANQNKSVDALLREDDGAPFKFEELPEMRNEKINGILATIEVKPKNTNQWQSIPFVVEDGAWKVALDVLYQNLQQQYLQEQKSSK